MTIRPKPITDHCSACGLIAMPARTSGGRGDRPLAKRVNATMAKTITAIAPRLNSQVARVARRRANTIQCSPGRTATSTAPLAANGCGSGAVVESVHAAAHRFAQPPDQHGESETGQCGDNQRELPAAQYGMGPTIPPLRGDPAQRQAIRRCPPRSPRRSPPSRIRAAGAAVVIDQAGAGRLASRFSDAHAQPRRGQHAETAGKPAQRRRRRPYHQ